MSKPILIPASSIPSFACSDERIRVREWQVAMIGTTHRDCDAIDESNHDVILEALARLDPSEAHHGTMVCGHWAVGTITHLIVDPRATALVACLEAFQRSLEGYAILDEMHLSQVERERHDDERCDEYCPLCEESDNE